MENDAFSSGDNVKYLVDSVINNCKNVEELALREINALHIPLINSTLCLTNEDCIIILNKCQQHCDSVLETSVLLIALTDFISCVSANSETFPLESKKNEQKRIALLMQILKNSWSKLFANLSAEDMSIHQMTGIATIVKRCLERIPPHRTYKDKMEKIFKMTDRALHMLLKPPKPRKQTKNINLSHEKQSSTEVAPSNCVVFAKVHPSPESVIQLPANRQVEHKKENKEKVKKSYDITKFVLKPCENVLKEETNKKAAKNLGGKRKFQEVEPEQTGLETDHISKNPAKLGAETEASPAKKHCVHDDFINGKMNAFKMLMKPRKTNSQLRQSNENS